MRFKEEIRRCFADALDECGFGGMGVSVVLEKPKLQEHGDISTPVALSLAKSAKKNPFDIAEQIAKTVSFPEATISSVDVVKPGYINLRIAQDALVGNMFDIAATGDDYGKGDIGGGQKCQIEYVSANPTGPLVVVSARAAAVGSVIVNLLRHAGYDAEGEYYVNDYGNQVEALGESLRFRVKERLGKASGEEIGAYPGEYLKDIAAKVSADDAKKWNAEAKPASAYGAFATEQLLERIQEDLKGFGVRFDTFFRESSLHPDKIEQAKKIVEEKGCAYSKDGALYFETTKFGDEKDRVMVKSDGNPTYFLGDIAYHQTKLARGYKWVIDLLGPDHHGHIPRMRAAASVIGADPEWFGALLVGWVRLVEAGKPVSMSKRAGEFITLRELVDDVGKDVAKYFFLMRRMNTPLDFDLDLARKQSDENPVYYVQYAHARISSVERFAESEAVKRSDGQAAYKLLETPEERELMVHLLYFPYVVEGAALAREPHRLTTFARELATLFHQFYHKRRVVTDDVDLSDARLHLVGATRQVLKNTLHLMGVDAPSSM